MERKLVSIQKVESVEPIPGADFIEKIRVLGWTLVARKGEFYKHDKCLYFEIDSVLPDIPLFEFVKSNNKSMRLKTKKIKKVISQGLALPMTALSEFADSKTISKLSIGDDVSDLIGVTKYEAPSSSKSASKGYWPFYLPKTDEIRVQSAPKALAEMQGLDCYITVELDGSSCTFSNKDGEFEVCSRNWALKDTSAIDDFKDDRWWQMAKKLNIQERLLAMGNYAIQGELCGPGIQKNRLGLTDLSFFVFNVYDIDNQKYLGYTEMVEFCNKIGLVMVPLEKIVYSFDLTQGDLLSIAEGLYEGTTNQREGIVVRPLEDTYSDALEARLSLKAISNKYLLGGGD